MTSLSHGAAGFTAWLRAAFNDFFAVPQCYIHFRRKKGMSNEHVYSIH